MLFTGDSRVPAFVSAPPCASTKTPSSFTTHFGASFGSASGLHPAGTTSGCASTPPSVGEAPSVLSPPHEPGASHTPDDEPHATASVTALAATTERRTRLLTERSLPLWRRPRRQPFHRAPHGSRAASFAPRRRPGPCRPPRPWRQA